LGAVCAISLALAVVGCPKKEEAPEASQAAAKADPQAEPAADPAEAPPEPADDADDAGQTAAPSAEGTGEPAHADAEDDADEETGEDTGAEPAEADPEGPDPQALLKTAVSPRTKDDEARALLGQAEEAGASVRDVAQAAVDRGTALHATPDRAKTFFEWAADKDPKFPLPVWQLARQAVIEGDIDRAKELLGDVKKRGGTRLLQQIDFDPMWDIVKDDPDVRKLL
jgi:hypothetical protein